MTVPFTCPLAKMVGVDPGSAVPLKVGVVLLLYTKFPLTTDPGTVGWDGALGVCVSILTATWGTASTKHK